MAIIRDIVFTTCAVISTACLVFVTLQVQTAVERFSAFSASVSTGGALTPPLRTEPDPFFRKPPF